MTASVSGFSILQGFASALDTMLPSAWTSSQPYLVGLWSQRMSASLSSEALEPPSLIPLQLSSCLLLWSYAPFAIRFLLLSSLVLQPMFLIWFNAEVLLLFLKQDPEVAHLAAIYLRWVSLGLPG